MSAKILLVEDDNEMRQVTRLLLERAGYSVGEATSGEEGLAEIARALPDLVLSDIELPGISGVKLCELLRGQPKTAALPIILLTVRAGEPDKVSGLKTGADDYVTKPFSPRELLARVETVLRRAQRGAAPVERFEMEGLSVDVRRHEVMVNGKVVTLARRQYELLLFFLKHPGELMRRERISEALWGEEAVVTDNTLSTHVKLLRATLGSQGKRIETLVGEGYRFNNAD